MKMYSVHDTAAEFYHPPFTAQTDAQASRIFVVSLGDQFPHRGDFNLYRIGEFDNDGGTLLPCDPPQCVLRGTSIANDLDPRAYPGQMKEIANA